LKVKYEEIKPDTDSSFRILLTPGLNDFFYWHFHPEYEIVYVEAKEGTRHIGDHISRYRESDLFSEREKLALDSGQERPGICGS
jgi:hypothetical protein